MPQAPSWPLALNTLWNVPRWPYVPDSLCWESPAHCLLVLYASFYESGGWRLMLNTLHRVDWSMVLRLGGMTKLTPKHPRVAYEACGTMPNDICGGAVDCVLAISGVIRRFYHQTNQPPIPSGLRTSHSIPLPCGPVFAWLRVLFVDS